MFNFFFSAKETQQQSKKRGWEEERKNRERERERERKRNKKRTSGRCIERGRFNFSGHIFLPLFLYIPASPSRNLNEVDIMPLRVSTDRLAPFIFIRGHTPRTVQPLPRFWFSFEFSTVIRIFYWPRSFRSFHRDNHRCHCRRAIISINSPLILKLNSELEQFYRGKWLSMEFVYVWPVADTFHLPSISPIFAVITI